jgi:hypothetical protein
MIVCTHTYSTVRAHTALLSGERSSLVFLEYGKQSFFLKPVLTVPKAFPRPYMLDSMDNILPPVLHRHHATAVGTAQQRLKTPQHWVGSSELIERSSQLMSWKGWTVGSYVYAWRPAQAPDGSSSDGQKWQNHLVLLIHIFKQETGETQFIAARLVDRCAVAQRLVRIARCARCRTSVSL